ncbi:hypothetical protein E0K99_01620 [Faecalicoccus pleomorphus]|uniref:C39 family peptidase n=1 Tax=Faecalicoccus pleomorphus TaxID=1323 RepID=UPI001430B747|nr:C39 family peptidase [Faecalicoccus pleomorphus]NJE40020.1 hypothetical protein [Faecalicoccus pleomorphus]
MKRVSKRKVYWGRLLVLILPVFLVLGFIGFGVYKLVLYPTEEILQVKKPEHITQETFDQLKEKTLENHEYKPIFLHLDQYSQDILDFLLKDEDRLSFVEAYPQKDNYSNGPGTLSETLDTIPKLLQWDLRWGYIPYGENDIYLTGCAPTCLSMVFSYLLQDSSLTPDVLASYSSQQGFYVNGAGTDWQFLTDAAQHYGVQVERAQVSLQDMKARLENHQILVCSMLPGDFTQVGHFILVTGMEDGEFTVIDPNSIKHTNQTWDADTLLSQMQAVWSYSV